MGSGLPPLLDLQNVNDYRRSTVKPKWPAQVLKAFLAQQHGLSLSLRLLAQVGGRLDPAPSTRSGFTRVDTQEFLGFALGVCSRETKGSRCKGFAGCEIKWGERGGMPTMHLSSIQALEIRQIVISLAVQGEGFRYYPPRGAIDPTWSFYWHSAFVHLCPCLSPITESHITWQALHCAL